MPDTPSTMSTSIITAIPIPAALIGTEERIVQLNGDFEAVFGTGHLGRHFVTAVRYPAVVEAVERAFAGLEAIPAVFLGREGMRDTTFDVFAHPVEEGVLLTLVDRTDALAASRMRSDFIANVSHELRTPLTAIIGFIETLRGAAQNDPKASERFLGIMAQEAGRMTRLVDELMSLSRLEGVERLRPKQKVSLNDIIQSAQDGLLPIAQSANVTLRVAMPIKPVIVTGDQAQLVQVLTNLIENAVKYGRNGAEVFVDLHPVTDQPKLRARGALLTVRDLGEGIDSHHIPRLTERFYRVDSHRSREVGGTGLGLAIVKHIINRHRGFFKIESEVGKGTLVSVVLPE